MEKSDEKTKNHDMERLRAMIDDAVTDAVRLETRGLKMQVQSALDALEFYQKSTNMRFGALLGHETKKKDRDQVIIETPDINEAMATVNAMKEKMKGAGVKPAS